MAGVRCSVISDKDVELLDESHVGNSVKIVCLCFKQNFVYGVGLFCGKYISGKFFARKLQIRCRNCDKQHLETHIYKIRILTKFSIDCGCAHGFKCVGARMSADICESWGRLLSVCPFV